MLLRMRFFPFFLFFVLVGCSEDDQNVINEENLQQKGEQDFIAREMIPLLLDQEKYIQTVGFISNSEVIYITHENGYSNIYRYDLLSGKSTLLNKVEEPVIQAFMHPSKKFIMLHCSDSEESAIVKMMSVEGQIMFELAIPSKEIYLNWHPENQELLFISAFNSDFSFTSFVYDGKKDSQVIVDLPTPFASWLNEEELVYGLTPDDVTQGKVFYRTDWRNGDVELLSEKNDLLLAKKTPSGELYISLDSTDESFHYIYNKGKDMLFSASTAAISSFLEWYVPDIQFGKGEAFYTLVADDKTVLEEYNGEFTLQRFDSSGVKELITMPMYTPYIVSPNEKWIFYGYDLSNAYDVENEEEHKWLILK